MTRLTAIVTVAALGIAGITMCCAVTNPTPQTQRLEVIICAHLVEAEALATAANPTHVDAVHAAFVALHLACSYQSRPDAGVDSQL